MQTPFLLIWHGGFSVHSDALSEPWMMTRTAMNNFRNAVCHDGTGTTCTIIDVIPLRAVTLRDRTLPWRQIPVRLVRQPGPDLSLADVRVRLLSILQGDSEIADVLEVPVDQAIAWVRKALTLVALARQVPVHPDRREMGGASGNLPAMNFRDMSPRRFRAGLWS